MNPIKIFEKIPLIYQVLLVIVTIFISGSFFGSSLAGLSNVPAMIEANRITNIRQDSIDAKLNLSMTQLSAQMNQTDQRISILVCLLTTQFEGTNPIRCNEKEK